MKLGKTALYIVFTLLIVVGAGTWYALNNLNSIVKELVENIGSDTLKTDVSLANVDIKLAEGSAELGNFSIGNYSGFAQPSFVAFNKIVVDIDPASMAKDVIVIDQLVISGVSIVAEQKGTTTNLQALLKALPSSGSDSSTASDSSTEASQEIYLAVKSLQFVDNTLSVATEKYGTHTLKLPTINQSNLGSTKKGLSPEQLAVAIMKPLIEQAKDTVQDGLEGLAKEELKKRYGKELKEQEEKLKSQLQDKLGDDAEEKLKGLKKLF